VNVDENVSNLDGSDSWGAGGINVYRATLDELADSDFSGNQLDCGSSYACHGAGGLYLEDSDTQKVVRNEFLRNSAAAPYSSWVAGGARLTGDLGSVVVAQNLFAENSVTSSSDNVRPAGGLMLYGSMTPFVVNNTIASNVLALTGSPSDKVGGVYCTSSVAASAFHSLIVWGNDEDAVLGDGCVPDYSDINGTYPAGGTGNISGDPRFQDPAGDDYTLQWNSPCINQGHPDPAFNDPDDTRNDMGFTGGPDY
jgi:hypothetical protein